MIISLSGPSAAGKDKIAEELLTYYGANLIISHTTREPRPGEIPGEKYDFITVTEFNRMLGNGEFAEHVTYNGESYGISAKRARDAALSDDIYVLVAIPDGVLDIGKIVGFENMLRVYVECDPGTRMKRYIDRIGAHDCTMTDILQAVNRMRLDEVIFEHYKSSADLVIDNSKDFRYEEGCRSHLMDFASEIYVKAQEKLKEKEQEDRQI